MAAPLNPNFKNRVNLIAIGQSHNAILCTDGRPIESGVDGGLAPDGAPARSIVNRTSTGPDLPERAVVQSPPGSGSFNPEV